MIDNIRELTHSKHQTFIMNVNERSPTQLQKALEKKGIKGFVVNVEDDRVTMLVRKQDIKHNRGVCNVSSK